MMILDPPVTGDNTRLRVDQLFFAESWLPHARAEKWRGSRRYTGCNKNPKSRYTGCNKNPTSRYTGCNKNPKSSGNEEVRGTK
jgi:hypothetical protein